MKDLKELTKAKKVAKKRVVGTERPEIIQTAQYLHKLMKENKEKTTFDDINIKFDQREIKPKTNYLKDALIVIATVAIIFTVAWLATLEAGTLKTCYEIWHSVK